ncbi:glucose-1-phosphate thymidylyltransferase [Bremerella cremea]|uniref:Glucose-1-phosphate thymidylyltransferase n=1 Tax=Bremerella cremea TaxID=1031537 RepID=A0A368KK66_9BACT|nr:putative sugar nucleotidyl transferase [Bremerella cremea]RCS41166.1 glucose-1-phosphate thymidylyltransferase [Bremerella cremea]
MNCIIFEDRTVSKLYPIVLGRPAYAILCGSYRLAELALSQFAACRGIVRHHLTSLQQQSFPELHETQLAADQPTLILNASLVPSVSNLRQITQWAAETQAGLIQHEGRLVAALLPPEARIPTHKSNYDEFLTFVQNLTQSGDLPICTLKLNLFEYSHDVVHFNEAIINENLEARLKTGRYQEVRDGLFVAGDVRLGENLAIDATSGPILLEEGTSVGPFCFLRGPAYLGKNVKVIEHSAIKDAVSLGHTTKIGGEVEATVIEPYSNKQHHGFLGHSYLGSWINLGAGTSNSDLKNTYGTVNMEYPTGRVATKMQFVGSIFGDYSKTAINTGIFTGKTIGVCSMLYGFVTTNVPSFVNYARLFGQVTELPPDVMISTQQRMFARRNVPQTDCDIQLIHNMYLLTQEERHLTGEPLVF